VQGLQAHGKSMPLNERMRNNRDYTPLQAVQQPALFVCRIPHHRHKRPFHTTATLMLSLYRSTYAR
jgi:hypothetical protein